MVSTHQPGISPIVQNNWAANYRQLLTHSIALFDFFDKILSRVPVAVSLQPVFPVNSAAKNLGPNQAECDRPIPATL
ncbi:hypothetical protein [Oscillatoria nigro-viridis]|uniref:hypothetical protein n=1 Tax=Phormidium nigroviride TaxID=482564 RepID=UPI0005A0F58F|nr:hypothetical protein [Oscillatoria nigro-viridis]